MCTSIPLLDWGVQGTGGECLCCSLRPLCWKAAAPLSSEPLSVSAHLQAGEGDAQGEGTFPLSRLPPRGIGPVLIPF